MRETVESRKARGAARQAREAMEESGGILPSTSIIGRSPAGILPVDGLVGSPVRVSLPVDGLLGSPVRESLPVDGLVGSPARAAPLHRYLQSPSCNIVRWRHSEGYESDTLNNWEIAVREEFLARRRWLRNRHSARGDVYRLQYITLKATSRRFRDEHVRMLRSRGMTREADAAERSSGPESDEDAEGEAEAAEEEAEEHAEEEAEEHAEEEAEEHAEEEAEEDAGAAEEDAGAAEEDAGAAEEGPAAAPAREDETEDDEEEPPAAEPAVAAAPAAPAGAPPPAGAPAGAPAPGNDTEDGDEDADLGPVRPAGGGTPRRARGRRGGSTEYVLAGTSPLNRFRENIPQVALGYPLFRVHLFSAVPLLRIRALLRMENRAGGDHPDGVDRDSVRIHESSRVVIIRLIAHLFQLEDRRGGTRGVIGNQDLVNWWTHNRPELPASTNIRSVAMAIADNLMALENEGTDTVNIIMLAPAGEPMDTFMGLVLSHFRYHLGNYRGVQSNGISNDDLNQANLERLRLLFNENPQGLEVNGVVQDMLVFAPVNNQGFVLAFERQPQGRPIFQWDNLWEEPARTFGIAAWLYQEGVNANLDDGMRLVLADYERLLERRGRAIAPGGAGLPQGRAGPGVERGRGRGGQRRRSAARGAPDLGEENRGGMSPALYAAMRERQDRAIPPRCNAGRGPVEAEAAAAVEAGGIDIGAPTLEQVLGMSNAQYAAIRARQGRARPPCGGAGEVPVEAEAAAAVEAGGIDIGALSREQIAALQAGQPVPLPSAEVEAAGAGAAGAGAAGAGAAGAEVAGAGAAGAGARPAEVRPAEVGPAGAGARAAEVGPRAFERAWLNRAELPNEPRFFWLFDTYPEDERLYSREGRVRFQQVSRLYFGMPVVRGQATMLRRMIANEDGTTEMLMYGAHQDTPASRVWIRVRVNDRMEIVHADRAARVEGLQIGPSGIVRGESRTGFREYMPRLSRFPPFRPFPIDPSGLLGEWFAPFVLYVC